jgi:hypothetical protein
MKDRMSKETKKTEKLTQLEWHRKMAAQLFNHTWDLIDKGDKRTPEEDEEMIHSAHASRYNWGVVVASGEYPNTGPMNLERGDWQISRVYSLLKRAEPALHHAQKCLEICEKNTIGDFDIAFAYEAMARALALTNDDKLQEYLDKAKKSGEAIAKEDDKKYFFSELENIK